MDGSDRMEGMEMEMPTIVQKRGSSSWIRRDAPTPHHFSFEGSMGGFHSSMEQHPHPH